MEREQQQAETETAAVADGFSNADGLAGSV